MSRFLSDCYSVQWINCIYSKNYAIFFILNCFNWFYTKHSLGLEKKNETLNGQVLGDFRNGGRIGRL